MKSPIIALIVLASTVASAALPTVANAAEYRNINCNAFSGLKAVTCDQNRQGVGLGLNLTSYCVDQFGKGWSGTGRSKGINGQRQCKKGWW